MTEQEVRDGRKDQRRRGARWALFALAAMVPLLATGAAAAAGTGWSVQPTPALAGDGALSAVACPTTASCTAVGWYAPSLGSQPPLVEHWNGTAWSTDDAPTPAGTTQTFMTGVSCPSAGACVAVGWANTGTASVLVGMHSDDGKSWTLDPVPDRAGTISDQLNGVSCTSASSCTAVGVWSGVVDHAIVATPLVERWNGSRWSRQAAPTRTETFQLYAVSCPSPGACMAVGNDVPSSGFAAVAEAWNGSSWRIVPTPKPAGSYGWLLDGVSCTSARSCTAVGYEQTAASATELPLVEAWNGSRWSIGSMPVLADAVSCASARACVAVGEGAAEAWNGTKWAVQKTPARTDASLAGVSCLSGGTCTAVGTWGARTSRTLAERRS